MKFHPLVIDTPLPACFNNPFDYEPDALCRAAAAQLQATLPPTPTEGKMYGVLIVEHQGQIGYLQAYSGQMEKTMFPQYSTIYNQKNTSKFTRKK